MYAALTWDVSIGLDMVGTIAIGVWLRTPRVDGIPDNPVRAACSRLVPRYAEPAVHRSC